jgi:hypothetical protein
MNGQEMISQFRLYTAFTTDMSDNEILALLNRKYRKLLTGDMWEFLRKTVSGTISSTNTITTPIDFDEIMPNWCDDPSMVEPNRKTVMVNNASPYYVIPMGARNSTYGQYCWLNPATNEIGFTGSMGNAPYAIDYKHVPADITALTTSVIPSGYESVIIMDALIDEEVIQKSDRARSNAKENFNEYKMLKLSLARRNLRASIAQ